MPSPQAGARIAPYPSIMDYAHLFRVNRWLVLGVTVACTVIALGLSLAQPKSYVSTAQLAVRDESQDLALIGTTEAPTTASTLASNYAADVTRPEVIAAAAQQLRITPASLRRRVTASVDPATNDVDVSATARDPGFAARIANAVAEQDATITTDTERQTLAAQAQTLAKRTARHTRATGTVNDTARSVTAERISDLYALSTIATPVEVQSAARVPSSPASPKPLRNAVLGLVIGVILGILASLLRRAVDVRVSDAEEVAELVGLPVLGNLESGSLGIGHGGSDGHTRFSGQDFEALRIIRQNIEFTSQLDGRVGRSIMVASSVPGEGKTTVSLGLALASAAVGKRTLLVEGDLRRPVLADRLGLGRVPGRADYLAGSAEAHEVLQSLEVGAVADVKSIDAPQLTCIVAGCSDAEPAELLRSERFAEFMREVASVYDVVVVDSAPLLPVVDAVEIAQHCDHLVMCVRLHHTKRSEVTGGTDALGRVPTLALGVVATGIKRTDSSYYGGYYASYATQDEPARRSLRRRQPVAS